MDTGVIIYLLDLLHDAAARLEDYLTYDDPKGPLKERFKEELILVLKDIQVSTLCITRDIDKEDTYHG